MNTIYSQLVKEQEALQKQISVLLKKQQQWPEEHLEICTGKGFPQYYYVQKVKDGGRARRRYIKKSELLFAESIAQGDYERKLLAELQKRWKAVTEARAVYEHTAPENIGISFSRAKQKLIRPLIPSDKEFAEEWLAAEQEKKRNQKGPFFADMPEIYTVRGERVRSKSEKIIADTLDRYDIPYVYEAPLALQGGITVCPDFKTLNVSKRQEFIYEHFGMMDHENYGLNVVNKLNSYLRSGYFPGKNLIFTMESSQVPLSTRTIEEMIRQYLID